MRTPRWRSKSVFIAGGTTGLGKEIAKTLASHGAHITIFAGLEQLKEAKEQISAARKNLDQEIRAISCDLTDFSMVDAVFRSPSKVPPNNYLTAAYAVPSVLKIWTENDAAKAHLHFLRPRLRQIVFINGNLSMPGMAGSAAYNASKCALRGLADSLRKEALQLSNKKSTSTIHCAFPSKFISTVLIEEQNSEPELTKKIDGTVGSIIEVEKRLPSAKKVACEIIAGVVKGDFVICQSGSNFMVGPWTKRGFGTVAVLAIIASLFLWPMSGRRWEMTGRDDIDD